ncbi:MAG: redox-regulated ATPase YchF [Rhodospirillales bacterium]|jgi:hypothetical protein|nr:redox-regulated ATPase YchF [Rhodospirillales bacterium]MDP6772995.1 redox-regulated ATPase YchF [Rhodospirillales bacterium]
MGFNCGIVGLPNVGKSTLFNALTATAQAEAANYPFTTVEPNVGRIAVPDPRLDEIAAAAGSSRVVPTHLEFVDIAGLVRGASRGEGLGNRFLGAIREVDAIAHVVRCFADDNVTHVDGAVDAVRDAETIETELMLADLESLEGRVEAWAKKARGGDDEAKAELAVAEPVLAALREGTPARQVAAASADGDRRRGLYLITDKPMLFVCNVDEASLPDGNALSAAAAARAEARGLPSVVISAKIESEVAALDEAAERAEFLAALGLAETGLARLVHAGYGLLGLITFFTANRREAHAWTVRRGTTAQQAAGAVHTDFARGFIAAETISCADFVAHGGERGAKDAGAMRQEGRDYVVQDGDVILFRFNV